jgi:hypothetical protein
MFPDKIEDLTDGSVDHDYDLLWTEGRKSFRSDKDSPQATPGTMTISHNDTGSGDNLVLNSLVRFDKGVINAAGKAGNIAAYLVVRNPTAVATAAEVLEVAKQLVDFLNTGTNASEVIAGTI